MCHTAVVQRAGPAGQRYIFIPERLALVASGAPLSMQMVPQDQQLIPWDEAARLDAVRRYDILDSPPEGAFDRVAALAAQLFDVPIALISVVDADRIWLKSSYGLDIVQLDRTRGLCASAILEETPWVVTDAATDPRTNQNLLVSGDFGLRFYAGAPLTTHDGFRLGTLCVIDKQPRTVSQAETRRLSQLAELVIDELELRRSARAAVAAAEQRLQEVERFAKVLQTSLLPPSLPPVPFLSLAALYQPQSRYEVGGDFYDVFPINGHTWGLVIGDVCGKGPVAAGRTSCARYSVRTSAIHDALPGQVLQTTNQALLVESPYAQDGPPFVTALFARTWQTGGRTVVQFASAGHPLPIVVRATGTVEVVGTPGSLLGVLATIEVTDTTVELNPGDTMVLVTDGVHDSGSPERLEQEGLLALLATCRGLPAQQVVDLIYRRIAGEQRDDVAIMALTAR